LGAALLNRSVTISRTTSVVVTPRRCASASSASAICGVNLTVMGRAISVARVKSPDFIVFSVTFSTSNRVSDFVESIVISRAIHEIPSLDNE
jgi:hypothetical protein